MTAPGVDQSVASRAAHTITASRGPRTNPTGKPFALTLSQRATPAAQLADLLGRIPPSIEAWWSPHTWTDDRRDSSRWLATSALVVDVDFHDQV